MKKLAILSVFALAASGIFLVVPSPADASCACVSESIDTDGDEVVDSCQTTCCANGVPSEPPSEPPSGTCGEICITNALTDGATGVQQVEQAILVAGSDASGEPTGCVGILGGTIHSNQATEQSPDAGYGDCLAEAVAACEDGGCATTTTTEGACE